MPFVPANADMALGPDEFRRMRPLPPLDAGPDSRQRERSRQLVEQANHDSVNKTAAKQPLNTIMVDPMFHDVPVRTAPPAWSQLVEPGEDPRLDIPNEEQRAHATDQSPPKSSSSLIKPLETKEKKSNKSVVAAPPAKAVSSKPHGNSKVSIKTTTKP